MRSKRDFYDWSELFFLSRWLSFLFFLWFYWRVRGRRPDCLAHTHTHTHTRYIAFRRRVCCRMALLIDQPSCYAISPSLLLILSPFPSSPIYHRSPPNRCHTHRTIEKRPLCVCVYRLDCISFELSSSFSLARHPPSLSRHPSRYNSSTKEQ